MVTSLLWIIYILWHQYRQIYLPNAEYQHLYSHAWSINGFHAYTCIMKFLWILFFKLSYIKVCFLNTLFFWDINSFLCAGQTNFQKQWILNWNEIIPPGPPICVYRVSKNGNSMTYWNRLHNTHDIHGSFTQV